MSYWPSRDTRVEAFKVHHTRLQDLGYTFEDDQGDPLTIEEASERRADGLAVVYIAP